jgi:hypothetical protein
MLPASSNHASRDFHVERPLGIGIGSLATAQFGNAVLLFFVTVCQMTITAAFEKAIVTLFELNFI